MAANTAPIFLDTPLGDVVQISTANTNLDGTGTLGSITTGATDGTRIDRVLVKATVTTTAGAIRFFYYNGTSNFLIAELLVTAITPSVTVKAWEGEWVPNSPLILPSGHILKAATNNAEAFNVLPFGGDF